MFVSDRDGNPEIYVLDDAGQLKGMTDNPSADIQPAWEPGLQRFAFTTNRDGQNGIYLANADGTNPVDLTNNTAYDQQPAWSVDGQWIAFASNRDGNREVYITKPGILELYNLTNNPSQDQVADWR